MPPRARGQAADGGDEPISDEAEARMMLRDAQSRADKQIDTIYKAMRPLKEVGWHAWAKAFATQAYAYEWSRHIYDSDVLALTPDQIVEADADATSQGLKDKFDRRNAYLGIIFHTRGDTVESLLEDSTPGDPRKAYDIMSSFYNPRTTAGAQQAYKAFTSASMAQSGTNIVSWVAFVSRAAKVVRNSGGQADARAELSILMGGLLPEFNPIKTILNNKKELTLPIAISRLMDHARSENLLELRKGGTAKGGNNIFLAASVSDEVCKNWPQFRCVYDAGECPRIHSGKGGIINDYPQNETHSSKRRKEWQGKKRQRDQEGKQQQRQPGSAQQNISQSSVNLSAESPTFEPAQPRKPPMQPTEAQCCFCLDGSDHLPEQCPIVNSVSVDFAYMAGATQTPSLTFSRSSQRWPLFHGPGLHGSSCSSYQACSSCFSRCHSLF